MDIEISWKEPWRELDSDEEKNGLQNELNNELSDKHILWGLRPEVIGRRVDNDDILVLLSDNRVAIVHLTWSGAVDRLSDVFPGTIMYQTIDEFLSQMEYDAIEYNS